MKYILIQKFALWLLDKCKVNYFIYPREENQLLIEQLVTQVEAKWGKESGEFKRSQVLRAALNAAPNMSESEIAFAIELAIQRQKHV